VTSLHLKIAVILSFTTLLSGCKDALPILVLLLLIPGVGNDPEDPEVCVHPIEDNEDASYVAAHIASAIRSGMYELPDGIHSEVEVPCFYGTMTITGVISRVENESCGTDCVTSYNNHEAIANLSDCSYIYRSFLQSTITGVINYSDTTGVQQIGESFSTLGSITITDNGTEIGFRPTSVYNGGGCDYSIKEVSDTIYSISSSGVSSYQWDISGSLTSTGGTFFFSPEPAI
jgi:hypothetical protein